ncbi:MAG: LysR family transcriptional regulator [Acidimicrobiales bacterium]
MWNDISARHLLALRAVSDEGTFGKAAQRLGFTQSAVSQQIAALEQIVGQTLFDRPSGPFPPRLTPAGALLLEHAADIIDSFETAERELARLALGVTGHLRVGTFQSISARVIPAALGRLHLEAPDVEVTLVEGDPETDARIEAIRRGDLDLAFVIGDVDIPGGSRWLGDDPHVAVVPASTPDGPLELAEMGTQPMIGQPPEDTCGLLVDRELERLGITPRYVFRSHDNGAVQGMVGAGVGIAIVPLLAVDVADPTISVRPTVPPVTPRRVSIIWDPQRTLPATAERFLDLVTEICETRLDTGGRLLASAE